MPSDGITEVVGAGGVLSTEEQYPYTAQSLGKCQNATGVRTGITGFRQVTAGDEAAMLTAAHSQPILSIGVDASHSSFQFYSSGTVVHHVHA